MPKCRRRGLDARGGFLRGIQRRAAARPPQAGQGHGGQDGDQRLDDERGQAEGLQPVPAVTGLPGTATLRVRTYPAAAGSPTPKASAHDGLPGWTSAE
jgi:hypothetical protein